MVTVKFKPLPRHKLLQFLKLVMVKSKLPPRLLSLKLVTVKSKLPRLLLPVLLKFKTVKSKPQTKVRHQMIQLALSPVRLTVL